jgi:hypothetical protein
MNRIVGGNRIMIQKRTITISLATFLLMVSIAGAATLNSRDALRENQKMRQNITWLVAGLAELGKSTQTELQLTPAEAQKILPIYEGLITRKIVILNSNDFPKARESQPSGSSTPAGSPAPSNPQPRPPRDTAGSNDRLAKLAAETAFANSQADQVDALLTKKQVVFIDNLNFDPVKYGYLSFTRGKSANGTNSNQPSASQAPVDPRQQLEKGRLEQVKLNNQVYRMLQQMK